MKLICIAALALTALGLCLVPGARAGEATAATAASEAKPTETPEVVLGRIRTHIEALLQQPQPPLFERHLRSVLAICEQDVRRVQFAGPRQEEWTKELLDYLQTIEAGLNDDGDKPESYLVEGRRDLSLARLSRYDNSLQFYTVSLPAHWDPNKAYPMCVMLHGSGPMLPVAYVYFTLRPHEKPKPEAAPQPKAEPGPEMIVIGPSMRGNRPWRENGDVEADIWEAIADVQSFAKLDPERWYIWGHSMGASDTWALINRTPDVWAAAGMLSGHSNAVPLDSGLLPNLSHLPLYLWMGETDPIGQQPGTAKDITTALTALGSPPTYVVEKGVGHMYRWSEAEATMRWLAAHTRTRPDHFSFVVDTIRHRGIWGVTVPVKGRPAESIYEPRVQFECWIEGQTVRIKTDAKQVEVDLGPKGLRLTGNVTVFVNDKQMYEGPVQEAAIAVAG